MLDILSDLMYIKKAKKKTKTDKLSKTNILLSWQLLSGHTHRSTYTPLWSCSLVNFVTCPLSSFSPFSHHASISDANGMQPNNEHSYSTAQLLVSTSMQHLLFPVGNYLFPGVIILQHAADPISNTSHSTCNQQAVPGSLQCPLYLQPPMPGAGVKGADKWLEAEGEGEITNIGWNEKLKDGCFLEKHQPYTLVPIYHPFLGVPGRICGRQMIVSVMR